MRTGARGALVGIAVAVLALGAAAPAVAGESTATPHRLVSGLAGGSGSTIGPDGGLYVTEPVNGHLTRVDRRSGRTSLVADCLPKQRADVGLGGAMDVGFLGGRAYVVVTLVGEDVGGHDVVGLYRVDGRHTCTVVADIGAWAKAHPPHTDFFVPTGVQYALERYRDGFLVTDGHHNRVLSVSTHGRVSEVLTLGNVVPTGLAVVGRTVLLAEAGPVPHRPADGRVVAFCVGSSRVTVVAAGAPLLVDVEPGRGHELYALAQGTFGGGEPGAPASPRTGSLVRADGYGGFDVLAGGLDRPTSLEVVGSTAYVVTLTGEVWTVDLRHRH